MTTDETVLMLLPGMWVRGVQIEREEYPVPMEEVAAGLRCEVKDLAAFRDVEIGMGMTRFRREHFVVRRSAVIGFVVGPDISEVTRVEREPGYGV